MHLWNKKDSKRPDDMESYEQYVIAKLKNIKKNKNTDKTMPFHLLGMNFNRWIGTKPFCIDNGEREAKKKIKETTTIKNIDEYPGRNVAAGLLRTHRVRSTLINNKKIGFIKYRVTERIEKLRKKTAVYLLFYQSIKDQPQQTETIEKLKRICHKAESAITAFSKIRDYLCYVEFISRFLVSILTERSQKTLDF
ncbi:MAG: uncharacterized protein A8A55_0270 [Amphiamblys sp. WSBS2006]|nr:MAG: uncharacterized protein A8A55_0270 [Amphiamblys sp. WSBS2006]